MADYLDELLGTTPESRAAYENAPRSCCGRRNGDPLEERTCSEGQCIEWWCPCGVFDSSGYGPVGCPCNDKSPWTEVSRG